jgi:hypothetical protein
LIKKVSFLQVELHEDLYKAPFVLIHSRTWNKNLYYIICVILYSGFGRFKREIEYFNGLEPFLCTFKQNVRLYLSPYFDVTPFMQEFMGRNLLAMNVMWKYAEQVIKLLCYIFSFFSSMDMTCELSILLSIEMYISGIKIKKEIVDSNS